MPSRHSRPTIAANHLFQDAGLGIGWDALRFMANLLLLEPQTGYWDTWQHGIVAVTVAHDVHNHGDPTTMCTCELTVLNGQTE